MSNYQVVDVAAAATATATAAAVDAAAAAAAAVKALPSACESLTNRRHRHRYRQDDCCSRKAEFDDLKPAPAAHSLTHGAESRREAVSSERATRGTAAVGSARFFLAVFEQRWRSAFDVFLFVFVTSRALNGKFDARAQARASRKKLYFNRPQCLLRCVRACVRARVCVCVRAARRAVAGARVNWS